MEIAERRQARLQRQFDELGSEFDTLNSHVSSEEITQLLDPVADLLEEVENRKRLLEDASESASAEFYDRYVAALDGVDIRLQNLHEMIGYLELHSRQRSEVTEVIDDIQNVCGEICGSFNISPTVLPVIWMSYATLPIGSGDMSIYCLFLPRHSRPRQYQPLIEHEIGHALHDEVSTSMEFRNRVWELAESWGPEPSEYVEVWKEWYVELFCDACGVVSFGPGYVQAISDYIHNSTPFAVRPLQLHPPAALRLNFIELVARDAFPESAQHLADDTLEAVNQHLAVQELHKDEAFDGYVDDGLLDVISRDVQQLVSNDIGEIVEVAISSTPLSDVDEDIYYRVKINREWFQNGG